MSTSALYSLTVLIWGSSWLAIHFQIGIVPPEIAIVYRFVLASALLALWCLARGTSLRIALRHHPYLALLGFSLFSLNYLLFYYAAFDLATGLLAVIFSTMTVMNIFNSALFLKRKIQKKTVIAVLFGLTGMGLVFWPETTTFGSQAAGAIGMSLFATYLASIGNIVSARNQKHGISVAPANAIGMAYGVLFLLAFSTLSGTPFVIDTSISFIGSLLFLALFASAIAFGCYLTLVGRIGPENAAYATVLFPVVALALSTGFEGYEWQGRALVGVSLVLIGNVVVLSRPTDPAHFKARISKNS